VELDALEAIHPGELARITEESVTRYLDPTLAQRTDATERELDDWLESIRNTAAEAYASDLERIQKRYEKLRDELRELDNQASGLWRKIADEIEQGIPEIKPDMLPRPEVEHPINPLFDSRRTYLQQLEHYDAWKNPDH